jgi:hypothetical protein
MNTVKTFKGLNGKDLLKLANETMSPVIIDDENYILTPRKFVATNRIEICADYDADAVEVRGRFDNIHLVSI